MKKLLVLFMALFMLTMVACDSQPTEDYVVQSELEQEIADLQNQIDLLEERIENIIAVEGLNGQVVYYEKTVAEMKATLIGLEQEINFNDTLAPSYMVDENGDYVTFSDLAIKMKTKYFPNAQPSNQGDDRYEMIPYASMIFIFEDNDIDFNDVVARVILMIEELTNYEYYMLSSNGIQIGILYIQDGHSHQLYFKIPTVVLINDMFTLNFESVIGNEFESYFTTPESYDTIDQLAVKGFYDDYILNGTYDGYVLNYVE